MKLLVRKFERKSVCDSGGMEQRHLEDAEVGHGSDENAGFKITVAKQILLSKCQ